MPNANDFNRFAVNPVNMDISRSMFNMDHTVKFSMNVGDVVPFECREVLPGDTFEFQTTKVVRTQPLVTPVMDELILDTYYFFVPNRLVWDHWKEFMGENTQSAWTPTVEYEIPQLIANEQDGFQPGSVADYFGIPVGVADISVSALPFRAYALVCDEWFRSEALQNPVHVYKDDVSRINANGYDPVTAPELGGMPFKASKYFDYFTACLPQPQRGAAVTFNLAGEAPVKTLDKRVFGHGADGSNISPLEMNFINSNGKVDYKAGSVAQTPVLYPGASANPYMTMRNGTTGTVSSSFDSSVLFPNNLWADMSQVTTFNVNDLRTAFAIQRYLERSARSGGRYIEMIKAFFNVDSPDSRLQRSEYLGGSRMPLNINSVEQTSATEEYTTPQGNVAGYSLTGDIHGDFVQSFTEHGYILGLAVVRYHHSYQQGIERFWSRKTKFDFYNPVFANLGEMAVLNKEIYAGTSRDDEVFGYQEAWADYRYAPNRIAGSMRSNVPNSLDVWHFADDYDQLPSLGSAWIVEDKAPVDRTLAITSQITNQIICDFLVSVKAARPMPLYSIPGLIDHH